VVVRRLKSKTPCASVWKYVSLIAVLILLSFFPTTLASSENPGISSYGIIQYPNFIYQGTTTSIKVFYQKYIDYNPHAFEIIKDLKIDTIRVYGAGFSGFNMKNSDWAEKLSSFLDLCETHDVKVVFHHIADWRYGCTYDHPHVNIGSSQPNPWPFGIEVSEGIAKSKAKIDKLAGDNSLGRNFLTDPTVPLWILLNEPFIDVYTNGNLVLDWIREISTYMRSKGVKVAVGHPHLKPGYTDPSLVIPQLRGYVDYIIFHWYGGGTAVEAQNKGESVFDAVYNAISNKINAYKTELGNLPVEDLLIGESGIQRYETSGATEETRGEYYRAIFQASLDTGIGGVFPFIFFDDYLKDGTITRWGAVYIDETYFTRVTDQYKKYYSTS